MAAPEFFATDYSQGGFQGYPQPNSNYSQTVSYANHPNRKINIWTGRFEDEVPLLEGSIISLKMCHDSFN